MSIKKLISIKNPIVEAMAILNIQHDKLMPVFTAYATAAEKKIGSPAQYELKRSVLDITQCVACLPSDAVKVEIAIMGDRGESCDNLLRTYCTNYSSPSTYGTVDNTFLVVDAFDTPDGINFGTVPFSIQNNKIIFETNRYDGQKVTVQYLSYKRDCDGFLEIGENHVDAIKWYIVWQYLYSRSAMNSLEYGKMNKAEMEWHRECAHARANDAIPTPTEWKNIVGMTHDPYAGISLNSGMYTTLGGMNNIW